MKIVNENGAIEPQGDPYYYSGVGLPDHLRYLENLSREELLNLLPAILDKLDNRLRALERREPE
jgi:hypothetical protein